MLIEAIREDFALLDEWEDRYRYVIELGKQLEALEEVERSDENKVKGCASQVWLVSHASADDGARLHFRGDSDAHIVRGLIAILLAIVNDRTAEEIRSAKPEAVFDELGLSAHLTPQRSNGLAAMVGRIKRDAEAALAG
ncbi:MAG: hypothetical protein RLZ98_2073 [Pseudomonadota bacterium]|jgi:cysteine desulfuration protein SufE